MPERTSASGRWEHSLASISWGMVSSLSLHRSNRRLARRKGYGHRRASTGSGGLPVPSSATIAPPPIEYQTCSAREPRPAYAVKPSALGWKGSRLRRCRIRSRVSSNAMLRGAVPCGPSGSRCVVRIRRTRSGASPVSTRSGSWPPNPSNTALPVPCPQPVAPSEPNSSIRTRSTRSSTPPAASAAANRSAASIGPTVCEEDGPMPILKTSKTLLVMTQFCLLAVEVARRADSLPGA